MKRRILALALAGTTAFSVFGAAASANAASTTYACTTDEYVDAYKSYTPIAKSIEVKAATSDTYTITYRDINTGDTFNDKDAYLDTISLTNNTTTEVIYSQSGLYFTAEGKILLKYDDGTVDGSYDTSTDAALYEKYAVQLGLLSIKKADNSDTYLIGSSVYTTLAEALKIIAEKGENADNNELWYGYLKYNDTLVNGEYGQDSYKSEKPAYSKATYPGIYEVSRELDTSGQDASIVVEDENEKTDIDWDDWYFNSDITGEDTVTVYEDTTFYKNGTLYVTTTYTPTVYAYDFLPYSSATTIAKYWNNSALNDTASALLPSGYDEKTLTAETGRGVSGIGIRYDVISDWIDFLDELAINGDEKYCESLSDFKKNYEDMYYDDPYYSTTTGQLLGYKSVDLYNIETLLEDIYALNSKSAYYYANTSQLIYLMQQYEKYIDNYVSTTEVTTGDWGELLLEILNSADSDDFKKASDYKKYINKVEDLEDAYEDAVTVSQIASAEKAMYELLTEVPYTCSSYDNTALEETLESLYFNVGTAPVYYPVNPSTASSNVDYKNYNYLVAVGTVSGSSTSSYTWTWTTTYQSGYYSLYPIQDYYEYGNEAAVYNGNTDKNDEYEGVYATDEYQWFWNVYQLAANMESSNKYQGALDAVNDALLDAVAALEPTTSPSASESTALEEMMDKYGNKIESDYDAGYYGKYEQAYTFADEAEGKLQTRIAREIVEVAGYALTWQGTQNTVTKNMITELEAAIEEGEDAVDAIKNSDDYNAAQITALNKAISAAQDLVDLYEGSYSTSKTYQSVNQTYSSKVGDKDQMVISDIDNAIEAIHDAIEYSEIIMGWSQNSAGEWLYGAEDGYYADGWHKINSVWYYFDSDGTAKQSEWMQENGKWYWFNSSCGAAYGWAKVDGEWYYFNGDNSMATGWKKVDGSWYYLASSGKMVTGWCQVNGVWYYFSKESNALGQMLANTTTPDGYKVDENGAWVE